MPELSEIEYSRDATVAAVRDYYQFLTKMYIKESDILEPPEGGWPSVVTDGSLRDKLGKTDEVISLLRQLPYIIERAQGAAWCHFADWQAACHYLMLGRRTGEELRITSEGAPAFNDVPPHVVGLTSGGRDNPVFLLDTELGIVHFDECPGKIWMNPFREPVMDQPCDYAPENEEDWRNDAPAWAIADFFEILKDQFRELHYIPLNSRTVKDVYATYGDDKEGLIPMLQDIYREHGWPDLERYRKKECQEAVQKALREHYPDEAD